MSGYRTLSSEPLHVIIIIIRQHCQLYYFLHDYVERDFLDRVRCEFFEKMGSCAKRKFLEVTLPLVTPLLHLDFQLRQPRLLPLTRRPPR